jgi:hypothetical protein
MRLLLSALLGRIALPGHKHRDVDETGFCQAKVKTPWTSVRTCDAEERHLRHPRERWHVNAFPKKAGAVVGGPCAHKSFQKVFSVTDKFT